MASQKDVQGYTGFAVKQGEILSYLSKLLQLPFQDRWKKNNMEQEKKINLYPEHLINKKGVGKLLALLDSQSIFVTV